MYELAQTVDYTPSETQKKFSKELELEENDLSLAFSKFKKDNPCTWKQEFQFKLLSGRVHTNNAYFHMKHKPSKKCTFCSNEDQDFIHTYIQCPEVKAFRQALQKDWQGEKMTRKRWFLGVSETNDTLEQCKNIIAKEANHFIFKMNWAGSRLSLDAFKSWLKSDEEPEEALALRINKVFDHYLKWSNIQLLLGNSV